MDDEDEDLPEGSLVCSVFKEIKEKSKKSFVFFFCLCYIKLQHESKMCVYMFTFISA